MTIHETHAFPNYEAFDAEYTHTGDVQRSTDGIVNTEKTPSAKCVVCPMQHMGQGCANRDEPEISANSFTL